MRAYLRSAMLVACTIVAVPTSAQLITFETTPAGFTPLDNTTLLTQYALTGGGSVRFFFDVNTNNSFDAGTDLPAFFEEIGADPIGVSNGFTNSFVGTSDVATPPHGPQLGNWFLRTGNQGPPPPPFIIDYNTLQIITGLSGEIWDIDGGLPNSEQWNVDVLDGGGVILASQLSPLGNNQVLDGKPWTFGFSGLPLGVDKVRLTFVGTKVMGVGLAFNNFSPTFPVPEPSTLTMAALAAGAIFMRRIRRYDR